MLFTGKIQARLDAKGRVFFPAEFRREMGDAMLRLVLKQDVFQPCLVIYPYTAWEREVETLRLHLNRWAPDEAMVLRQFLSEVEVFVLDANGRFIVPKRFQDACGMTSRSVAFIGLDDRIELWDSAQVEKSFLSASAFGETLQKLMRSQREAPLQ